MMARLLWTATVALVATLRLVAAPVAADPVVSTRALQLSPEAADRSRDRLRHARIEAITYLSDGLRINGYRAMPNGSGPFPAVIVNRGGNANLGIYTDDRAAEELGMLAEWGYVAVASQYRGAGGSEGHDEFGGADVDDVLNMIPVLESIPVTDRTRIGMFGASRGGMMTYLTLTRTNRIKAAVIVSGMSDLFDSAQSRPEMNDVFRRFIPDYQTNREDALTRRSAVRWFDKLPADVPLLLVHGTADLRVSPIEAFDMARALYQAKRPMRLVMFEGGSYGVPEFTAQRNALLREWLDSYVRDGKKWPDLTPHGS